MHGRIPPILTGETRLAGRARQLRERIEAATKRSGRSPDQIVLVGVSKRQSAPAVREAWQAGIKHFGENYVAEAQEKQSELEGKLGADWHLIGALQRNKAARAVRLFELIETVDRSELASALGRHAREIDKVQRVLIEVNLSGEPERAGSLPEALDALCESVARTDGLVLEGLMGIAPLGDDSVARAAFARLRGFFESLPAEHRKTLSMGMSQDFEIALEEGATQVRIGTALFGERTIRGS
jgi:PLP dependent protein